MLKAALSQAFTHLPATWHRPFLGALGLTLGLLGLACSGPGAEITAAERVPAPDFHLSTIAGDAIGNREVSGKVAVLDFWATWCAPCHVQAEILHELHGEFAGTDLRILSIDSGEAPERVESFVAKNPSPYPVLLDEDGSVSDAFQVMGLPTLVILDRQGKIAYSFTGVMEAEELRPVLRQLLDGPVATG